MQAVQFSGVHNFNITKDAQKEQGTDIEAAKKVAENHEAVLKQHGPESFTLHTDHVQLGPSDLNAAEAVAEKLGPDVLEGFKDFFVQNLAQLAPTLLIRSEDEAQEAKEKSAQLEAQLAAQEEKNEANSYYGVQ